MKSQKLFFTIFTLVLVASFHPSIANAQSTFDTSETASSSYDLTYPGLLPDHPLYFLKVARDNFTGFFKGEPVDKASFALLQADKHMAATLFMITQKKDTKLAYISLENAQNYLEDAVHQTESAKQQGMDTHEICEKLKRASKKHIAVLAELRKQQDEKDSKKLEDAKKRADKLSELAANLRQ